MASYLRYILAAIALLDSIVAQVPANISDYKNITSPSGVTLRYKETGKEGVCETTKGVNSYSGYIDIAPDVHSFFWFFESRKDPANDPITLWLDGTKGTYSLTGLFQELGPCNVTENLETRLNPYSWNEVSNLLFISAPIGAGFSYSKQGEGSIDPKTGKFMSDSEAPVAGRFHIDDPTITYTTNASAVTAYNVLQGFYSALPQLDSKVKSKVFNLWTSSYGGHYGPTFFKYFSDQNKRIKDGKAEGIELKMNTLGIGNGEIDLYIQTPSEPEFAVNNTYKVKAINDTQYANSKAAIGECQTKLKACNAADRRTSAGQLTCHQASSFCHGKVQRGFYEEKNPFDIRQPSGEIPPADYFKDYLNKAEVQRAIGVNQNYTLSNKVINEAFETTGDRAYPDAIKDLQILLDAGVRVALYYGDATWLSNWFGGEAVSLAVNYTGAEAFRAAKYKPFRVNGVEHGKVRQSGNFSFLVLKEAGLWSGFDQPKASLEMFKRTITNVPLADGAV
ncbi:alpha/beta-hydrolase [Pseudovirgaria hyperparasitica]|uniref:Alpha/beta-hydrolase n=1 Tax=Pseudovirgaria hyperparasitica TaxID=470096 RepID=A0A6A6VS93_9PEZI|nr:alpha/beta-hydrolase [Pseudovirgaria hyperparasitica]KAF2753538.1 alpha/beta-hydrolase [Pseudovirgaria hyperparasitica]